MNTQNALFFWPGGINSSLFYVSWHSESKRVLHFFSETEPMYFCASDQISVVGGKAVSIAALETQFELQHLFSADVKLFGGQDVVDSTALIMNLLLQKMTATYRNQTGLEISSLTELFVLDFDSMFAESKGRLLNITRAYLSRKISVIPGKAVLRRLASSYTDHSTLVTVDDAISEVPKDCDHMVIDVFKKFDNFTFENSVEPLSSASLLNSLLSAAKKSQNSGLQDWYTSDYARRSEWGYESWSLDKRHLAKILGCDRAKTVAQLQEKLGDSDGTKALVIIGDYAKLFWSRINDSVSVPVYICDRPTLVKFVVNNMSDLIEGQYLDDASYEVRVGEQLNESLSFSSKSRSKKLNLNLRLFGKMNDIISLSIADEQGEFMAWEFEITIARAADILQVEITVEHQADGFIDCRLNASDEFELIDKKSIPLVNGRPRPIEKVIQIATQSLINH